jgi:hypothetical protein
MFWKAHNLTNQIDQFLADLTNSIAFIFYALSFLRADSHSLSTTHHKDSRLTFSSSSCRSDHHLSQHHLSLELRRPSLVIIDNGIAQ